METLALLPLDALPDLRTLDVVIALCLPSAMLLTALCAAAITGAADNRLALRAGRLPR
ncbi:MAG: hypothetical protein AAFS07_18375 [Pseudomonadota bacterium]